MRQRYRKAPRQVRTVFVSDIHLGSRHCQDHAFLQFLYRHQPETLYLVGDFVDGWLLKKSWYWPDTHHRILRRLIALGRTGTQIYCCPGNHDAFLSKLDLGLDLDFLTIAEEFVHHTADGLRLLVTHGDRFDRVENGAPWLSMIASFAYDVLLSVNRLISRVVPGQVSRCGFSAAVKKRIKSVVRFISDFEKRLSEHASEKNCDGVVCGHIHTPMLTENDEMVYCNTGDWVEHCTAIVEYENGELALEYFDASGPQTAVTERNTESRPVPAGSAQPVAASAMWFGGLPFLSQG